MKVTEISDEERALIRLELADQIARDLPRRSELRDQVQTGSVFYASNVKTQAAFILSHEQLAQLTPAEYRELVEHKKIQGENLYLVLTGNGNSARADELARLGSIYDESNMANLSKTIIKIEFKPLAAESALDHNDGAVFSEIYEGAFGVALLYALQDGKLEGVFKNQQNYLDGELSRWASSSLSLLMQTFDIMSHAA